MALITGASKGIGRQIAIRFAQLGYNVALAARSKEKLEELSQYIVTNFGVKTVTYPLDLGEVENAENVVHYCVRDLGNLHALILNAGVNRFLFLFTILFLQSVISQYYFVFNLNNNLNI